MTRRYQTPTGTLIAEDALEAAGRVVCGYCNTAVVEDEFFPCVDCGVGMCLYCYEGGVECVCKKVADEGGREDDTDDKN